MPLLWVYLLSNWNLAVVAPSLTPESYNAKTRDTLVADVVAPSLTPESYNRTILE